MFEFIDTRTISMSINKQTYSTIEYHNSNTQSDTTMFYDANGNLIRDLDRGITAIKYNILHLPDTILFSNGNRIVNLYDAAGRKYKSIVYTIPATAVTASYDMEHAAFDPDSMEYRITEYNGNIETCYTPRDTTRRIFNSIGYWADSTYFYTVKDHLGNICAVVNANTDTVVQRTMYYASGVPMAQSWGRDTQPYLYNGKEFIESHGWNTYDYGFRGYYAPTGRFTSIDPLAEQTPWQSPYVYANNNFINNIDWMGLSGVMSGFKSSYGWMAQDKEGNVVDWGEDENDWHVYEVDEDWDGTYKGLIGHSRVIGWEIFGMGGEKPQYVKRQPAYYVGSTTIARYSNGETYIIGTQALMYGNNMVDINDNINTNVEAVWHYYFGNGRPIMNGPFAVWNFMDSSGFRSILANLAKGNNHGIGQIDMELRGPQFHMGNTSYSYQVSGSLVIISLGLFDGFWDPRFVSEGICKWLFGVDLSDKKGPNLEAGGTPYDYIPSIIVLRIY